MSPLRRDAPDRDDRQSDLLLGVRKSVTEIIDAIEVTPGLWVANRSTSVWQWRPSCECGWTTRLMVSPERSVRCPQCDAEIQG
jgi:hypothetical protein